MSRCVCLAALLLIAACGAGENAAPPPVVPATATPGLAAFEDTIELTQGLEVPALSAYWRDAGTGLPLPATVDEKSPLLAVRVDAGGGYASRARGATAWTQHADDLELLKAMQRNAGEIDFDTGLSELQILLCMHCRAKWEYFLGLLEMMAGNVRCHRLYVVTRDAAGKALRLLDLSLPLGAVAPGSKAASVRIERAEARDTATLRLDESEYRFQGESFATGLKSRAKARKAEPDVLWIRLPRDEPFETLFTVLDSLSTLGMREIRFGG